MTKRSALFAVWAAIGFGFALEVLYLFTPFGLAGLLLLLPLILWLEKRGWNQQPEIWGLLAGPGLFAFLVAASSDEPTVWWAMGFGLVGSAAAGFVISGRARCARA
jgi:hypothetical protein